MQKIYIYVQQGNMAGIARKIANGADIDCIEKHSLQTPLICAVSSP
ncbi:hypothetical protein IQ277_18160 [Nostocales cyanobacterium LEGE 12452]|nr:hypothetical protein [Nostocales cyanobacterium LEGE 12452]